MNKEAQLQSRTSDSRFFSKDDILSIFQLVQKFVDKRNDLDYSIDQISQQLSNVLFVYASILRYLESADLVNEFKDRSMKKQF